MALPSERAVAPSSDLLFTRDFILHLIERSDVTRLRNGHFRLVLPVTGEDLDRLAALGAACEDFEEDDHSEEGDPAEADGSDEPELGWLIRSGLAGSGCEEPCRHDHFRRYRDEFDFDGVCAEPELVGGAE
ncbi:hypothetical protein SAMN06297251_12740 [Fulvimarina manganoxydans]|uniref:Uncharacterized protein n=1 Tax=Fulvimarina manganoxydans TaxID=937218 RepID=A0A1W2EK84_9HYPH|nr:hypothetical protein [Fulvimarina manganoxydans]SMD10139.1 hypothetical protein SAMN06297251_12740 [Fulvimarina manganoxydans]